LRVWGPKRGEGGGVRLLQVVTSVIFDAIHHKVGVKKQVVGGTGRRESTEREEIFEGQTGEGNVGGISREEEKR